MMDGWLLCLWHNALGLFGVVVWDWLLFVLGFGHWWIWHLLVGCLVGSFVLCGLCWIRSCMMFLFFVVGVFGVGLMVIGVAVFCLFCAFFDCGLGFDLVAFVF